jgi:hypothetical protein
MIVGHDDKFHTLFITHVFADIRAQLSWTLANLILYVTELPMGTLSTPMRTPLVECMQRLSPTLSAITSDSILYIPERYLRTIETKLYLVSKADIYNYITHLLMDTEILGYTVRIQEGVDRATNRDGYCALSAIGLISSGNESLANWTLETHRISPIWI